MSSWGWMTERGKEEVDGGRMLRTSVFHVIKGRLSFSFNSDSSSAFHSPCFSLPHRPPCLPGGRSSLAHTLPSRYTRLSIRPPFHWGTGQVLHALSVSGLVSFLTHFTRSCWLTKRLGWCDPLSRPHMQMVSWAAIIKGTWTNSGPRTVLI